MSEWFLSPDTKIPEGRVCEVILDGVATWKLQCPGCGCWGTIDEDQLYGRVSVDHADAIIPCGFHETRDWSATARHVRTTASL